MNDMDRQDADLAENEFIQITDLDPAESPRRRRAERIIVFLHKGMATPRTRYGLLGLLLVLLLGVVFLPLHWPLITTNQQTRTWNSLSFIADPSQTPLDAALVDNSVYIQASDGIVTAYQSENGRVLWRVKLAGTASMQATDLALYCYFATSQGKGVLEALSTRDGRVLWQDSLPAPEIVQASGLVQPGPLMYKDGMLYAETSAGAIYAFQASDGHTLWTYSSVQRAPLNAVLHEQDGIVEINALDNTLHFLNASTGQETMRLPSIYTNAGYSVRLDGPLVYVLPNPYDQGGQSLQTVQVFRVADSKRLWTAHLAGMMMESDGVVYLLNQDGSSLTALRGDTGHTLWTYKPATSDFPAKAMAGLPTEKNGALYVLLLNGTLVRMRVSDGQIIWHTRIPGLPLFLQTTPFLNVNLYFDNGMLFLCDTSEQTTQLNQVYALDVNSGTIIWHTAMGFGGPNQALIFQAGIFYAAQGLDPNDGPLGSATVDAWRDTDGRYLWRYQSQSSVTLPWGPQNRRDIVFLFNEPGNLAILRTSDGKALWSYQAN